MPLTFGSRDARRLGGRPGKVGAPNVVRCDDGAIPSAL